MCASSLQSPGFLQTHVECIQAVHADKRCSPADTMHSSCPSACPCDACTLASRLQHCMGMASVCTSQCCAVLLSGRSLKSMVVVGAPRRLADLPCGATHCYIGYMLLRNRVLGLLICWLNCVSTMDGRDTGNGISPTNLVGVYFCGVVSLTATAILTSRSRLHTRGYAHNRRCAGTASSARQPTVNQLWNELQQVAALTTL